MGENLYLPQQAIIEAVVVENNSVNTYVLSFCDPCIAKSMRSERCFLAGQFMMVSIPHRGEAPISLSALPTEAAATFSLTVRNSGRLTADFHQLQKGDIVGVRGPYGTPFPLKGGDSRPLFIAGGIGMAPLRPVVEHFYLQSGGAHRVSVIYGCKTATEFCFQDDLNRWQQGGIECLLTVDQPTGARDENVGLVTDWLDAKIVAVHDAFYVCGPGVMIRFVIEKLEQLGVKRHQIITTLERHMKCGVGVCGHCHLDDKLVCVDGPVFGGEELPMLTTL